METLRISLPKPELLQRKLESLTVELLGVYEELALLYSLGAQIGRLTDEQEIGVVALEEAIAVSAADCGWLAFWDGTKFAVAERCRKGISFETVSEINRKVLKGLLDRGKSECLTRSFRVDCCCFQNDAPTRLLACALLNDSKCHGYLCLGRAETRDGFLSPDLKLVRALAFLVAVQLENGRLQRSELEKQRLLNELETARAIQQSLLPRSLAHTSFLTSAGSNEPCYQIGGDFYDLIPINKDSCMLIVADVSGKGPSAALQAAMVQGAIDAMLGPRPNLPSLLQKLNQFLMRRTAGSGFVTAFIATLHRNGLLQYVNAGHPAALWLKGKGSLVELAAGGPPVGLFRKAQFGTSSVTLKRGDLVLLYTDGITEAENDRGEVFGVTRLLKWAGEQYGCTCEDLRLGLLSRVAEFCGSKKQVDDRSVLVIQYQG